MVGYPSTPEEVAEKYFYASLNEKFDEAEKYLAYNPDEKKRIATTVYTRFLRNKYGENKNDIKIKTYTKYKNDFDTEIYIFVKNKSAKDKYRRNFTDDMEHPTEIFYLKKIDNDWRISWQR